MATWFPTDTRCGRLISAKALMTAEICDYVHISPHVSVIGGATGMLRMGHFTNLPGAVSFAVPTNF
jgi:hypothetical protein